MGFDPVVEHYTSMFETGHFPNLLQEVLHALGTLKGKCAFGPFLSILVIECQTQVLKCEFMLMDEQSANHK